MSKQLAKAQQSEDGFTLIEMIIAVVITTMITGALAAVFVTSGRSTSTASHRSSGWIQSCRHSGTSSWSLSGGFDKGSCEASSLRSQSNRERQDDAPVIRTVLG